MSWSKVKLGDVAETNLGKMLDQHKNRGDFHPYLANVNVRWGSFDLENLPLMKFESDELDRFGLRYGDLIVCEGGEPGRCAIWKENLPGIKFQKALHRVRVKDCMDYRYVFYWFLYAGKRHALDQYFTGSTIKHMPADKLRQVVIDYPPLKIQKKIGEVLSAYDNLIENNQKQIKLLEEAAQRLYKEWFIDLRFPGHETTKIKNGVPEGWNIKSVNSVVDFLSGYAFKSGSFVDSGKYKIVTIKNVQDGSFDGDNVSTVDEIPTKMPNHCVLEEGDVLLSLTGNVGRVCLVVGDDYLLNQRVAKLKSHYHAYTYCLFRSKDMFVEMNNLANGAAQQNLSPVRTGEIKITVPSESVLDDFESVVMPIIQQMIILNKQIVRLKQARDRLLPKLMSGEIEV
ncbi:MAG: restriction endonuclease subunit S [Fibrobacter sp.]|nr:restriction endonuclease subunit S [Fibrobacter sp.]